MFMDENKGNIWKWARQRDMRSFEKWLTPECFLAAAARAGLQEWKCMCKNPLCLVNMIWLGIAAAMQPRLNFALVLTQTLKLLEDYRCFPSNRSDKKDRKLPKKRAKHDPRTEHDTVTEEAFAQARKRMPPKFWFALLGNLVEQFEAQHGDRVRLNGFRLLAMDGTRLDVPDTARNRKRFGTARNAHGDHRPQARMTLLQFPLVRLPCLYELGSVKVGEVTMAGRLIKSAVRADDLVLLDAGFWSYGLLWQIQQKQAFFAIRLRSGLKLEKVRRLEPKDTLMKWTPKDSRRKWRQLPRSLDLRIIEYRIRGFRSTSIATNVLDPKRISREDWVRLTTEADPEGRLLHGLYHRRLEIETTYRELKVEQGMERLRSRTPESVAFEVAGHVLLYLLVRWTIVEAAIKHSLNPLQLSFLNALNELIEMRRPLLVASSWHARQELLPKLLDRIAKHRVRHRPGRHYPRKKKARPIKRKSSPKTKNKTPHRPRPKKTARQA
jgi:Transposase DDE domain